MPYVEWLTLVDALEHLGVDEGGPDADRVDTARRAVVAFVERNRSDLWTLDETGARDAYVPTDDVAQGARLVLARLYARRQSPAGIAAYGDWAGTILRFDPDAAALLGIGRYAPPRVG